MSLTGQLGYKVKVEIHMSHFVLLDGAGEMVKHPAIMFFTQFEGFLSVPNHFSFLLLSILVFN